MIESRCGILCSECDYREKMDCKGCVNISKPFWGDACPVKNCCENRKLISCGNCSEFPCELLNSYSYDKEHGYTIEPYIFLRKNQLALWAKVAQEVAN
ncbi:MAG: DUF3795 domain-containing protein [Fibrobacteres bacterium]|nr:DUF3795 domain-containing protein [Fibrobacterota bacterium]